MQVVLAICKSDALQLREINASDVLLSLPGLHYHLWMNSMFKFWREMLCNISSFPKVL